ncbi:TPA: Bro-N domain-containing protein [Clostridioides difficile]|uniref:BRO-N domain-containing protein n=4 Tax=Clostridioides difficile TaxID=1496 RepID=UPI00038C86A6|nr:Bro-N domain-containing protein [Clostridioides difficile]EQE00378.1 BRO family, N-terminal domain protein [Clostridioides difficile CD8]EQE06132.1 BRO family, N-terminal domain protein [Clostridioides difficile CD9]EQI99458.1 BRO family, N-terminal domain protein [Clostridioides difficile P5]ERM36361.1 BRO family, N-terminal domain protein [Clostridioides difficile P37]MCB4249120.1 Bro-N domain-containing protein [Clostridioides difficile]
MNNLMIFEDKQVEVFEFNGKILFNPYHCGNCLGISNEGVRKAITRMNENQVIKLTNSIVTDSHIRKLHNTGENFLTESGVYKLIFKSKKEEAEKFQDWVTDEVLPAIRQTGQYQAQQHVITELTGTIGDLKGTIKEYKKLCKITCSKKQQYSKYIKNRLDIDKANKEYNQVKARLFLILGVEKWEDIDFDTSNNLIQIIDDCIRVIKSERPYKQLSYFEN